MFFQVVFNRKDANTFCSASLDRTLKVWQLGSNQPNFTLEGHEKGVNCVDYYVGGDKPYLISGADDRMVKIWDYQNKTCVQTLEGVKFVTKNYILILFVFKLFLLEIDFRSCPECHSCIISSRTTYYFNWFRRRLAKNLAREYLSS